jgi:hypothetical protein
VGSAPVEALTVVTEKDRSFAPFTDGEVDGSCGAGYQRDQGRLVALADDPQYPVSSLEGHVLDVGFAGLAYPKSVQAEQHREGCVGVVEPLGGEEELAELAPVQPAPLRRVDLGAAYVLGRVGTDPTVYVGEAVEAGPLTPWWPVRPWPIARTNRLVSKVCKRALLCGLSDTITIGYRQRVLHDCLQNSGGVREMYDLAVEAVDAERQLWGLYNRSSPRAVLSRAVGEVETFVGYLQWLRRLSEDHADELSSDGFARLFKMVSKSHINCKPRTYGSLLGLQHTPPLLEMAQSRACMSASPCPLPYPVTGADDDVQRSRPPRS